MKQIIVFIIFNILLSYKCFPQCQGYGQDEIRIFNNTNMTILVGFYPVSMVFSGGGDINPPPKIYTLTTFYDGPSQYSNWDYINGNSYDNNEPTPYYYTIPSNSCKGFNMGNSGSYNSSFASFGYGTYKIEIQYDNPPPGYEYWIDSCTVEFDDYPLAQGQAPGDLGITVKNFGLQNRFTYKFCCGTISPTGNIYNLPNQKINIWEHGEYVRPKNYGDFKLINYTNPKFNYNYIPLDGRVHSNSSYNPYIPINQNHYYPREDYVNAGYYEERHGVLSLNLTIQKPVTSPPVRWGGSVTANAPTADIVILDGATLKIASGQQVNSNSENTLTLIKFSGENLGTGLTIQERGVLELGPSTNSNTRSRLRFENYCNLNVKNGGLIILGDNSLLELTGNSQAILQDGSLVSASNIQNLPVEIHIRNNAILHKCRSRVSAYYPGTFAIRLFDQGQYFYDPNCQPPVQGQEEYFEQTIELHNQSKLTIGSNTKMTFEGNGIHLKANPGTTIELGLGASIEFKNGAYLDANGATFTSLNTGDVWNGIKLENAGSQTIIQNCTFSNTTAPITIINTSGNENLNKIIKSNTFNLPVGIPGGSTAIYANNVFQLLVESNTFNLGGSGNTGLSVYNTSSSESEGDGPSGPPSSYSLNIIGNTFNGWGQKIVLNCLASNLTPFLIKSNKFYATPYSEYNAVFGNKITGDIKYNEFFDVNSSTAIALQQSTVNVYSNVFKSTFNSMELLSSSIAQIAPIHNGTQWVWYGGYNIFTADAGSCIYFSSGSNLITTPNGSNCFYTIGQPHYKLSGVWCSGRAIYNCYSNYWEPSPPVFNILCGGNPATVNYTPLLTNCPIRTYDDYLITDAGNGVPDTLFLTTTGDGGGISNKSRKTTINHGELYSQSILMRKQGDFGGAILKNKEIINTNDSSQYLYSSLSELYLNFMESDTTGNQNITNGLFNELKSYLAEKMQQYQADTKFVELAYRYVLMCLVKTESYQEAIAGYENIMNNHPDEIVRLNASWDRSAVVLLMGQGGSESNLQINSYKLRIKRLLDKNPAHKIAKEVFSETKENIESSDISDDFKYSKQEKAELERRIENFNPSSTEELRNKINSDIKLVSEIQKSKTERTVKTNTPKRFTLHQNYPNPFNPVTTIKYDIPKDGFITLKIYDVLGREVFSVNEFRKAGNHETVFDGSGFASGVYFYSLESNGLKETKKMLLIK